MSGADVASEAELVSEGEDVFEINDFTVVTDIESVTVAIEALIQKWNIYGRRAPLMPPFEDTRTENKAEVKFGANNMLNVTFHSTTKDEQEISTRRSEEDEFGVILEVRNARTDFIGPGTIPLLFGCTEYVVISPFDEENDQVRNENQMQLVLSAVRAALHSSRCEVPVFVRYGEEVRGKYFGFASDGYMNYNFKSACLNKISRRHSHLNGLINLFKTHIGAPRDLLDIDDVTASARFRYFKEERISNPVLLITSDILSSLPTRQTNQLHMYTNIEATWNRFREDALMENEIHSDFEPEHANNWNIDCEFDMDPGQITKCLQYAVDDNSAQGGNTLATKLANMYVGTTASSSTLSRVDVGEKLAVVPGDSSRLPLGLVASWVRHVVNPTDFTAASLDIELAAYYRAKIGENEAMWGETSDPMETFLKRFDKLFPSSQSQVTKTKFKAAPQHSLTLRIAIAMVNVKICFEESGAENQLWQSIIDAVYANYDACEDLYHVTSKIDFGSCLFHQKLQLLQACIEAKKNRMTFLDGASPDDFYDASSDFDESCDSPGRQSPQTALPMGRSHVLGNIFLLNDPETHIYVPVTQQSAPMTEDAAEKFMEQITQLSEAERMKVQLPQLMSDMEAFKAANPTAVFADFVRWHSSKDFDEEKQCLSQRMSEPENTWNECWEKVQPVAVVNQERIFNETRVAEEIFAMLRECSTSQIREFLRPVLFAAAMDHLIQHERDLGKDLSQVVAQVNSATSSGDISDYQKVIRQITILEDKVAFLAILRRKFFTESLDKDQLKVVKEDLDKVIHTCVEIFMNKEGATTSDAKPYLVNPHTPLGRCLQGVIMKDPSNFMRHPEEREYILHWSINAPSIISQKLPHRMYALLSPEKSFMALSMGTDVLNYFHI